MHLRSVDAREAAGQSHPDHPLIVLANAKGPVYREAILRPHSSVIFTVDDKNSIVARHQDQAFPGNRQIIDILKANQEIDFDPVFALADFEISVV